MPRAVPSFEEFKKDLTKQFRKARFDLNEEFREHGRFDFPPSLLWAKCKYETLEMVVRMIDPELLEE